jgi:4'-phosphopantetheinyl transferase
VTIHWALQTAASAGGETSLTLAERSRLAGLGVAKRRADFLLGRLTAKVVVAAALGERAAGRWLPEVIELPAEPGGAPFARLAPEAEPVAGFAPGQRLPVSVTISHTEGNALCAAAYTGPGAPQRMLGIDLGRIEPRSPALQATFFTEEERRWVGAAPPGQADLRANLIWCAKESALKVLGLGLTVDTLGITCLPEEAPADPDEWPLRPAEGTWRRFTAACAPELAAGGLTLRGAWRIFGGFVGALAMGREGALPAAGPPRP